MLTRLRIPAFLLAAIAVSIAPACVLAKPVISGELKQWHVITLMFAGPVVSEAATPNPFTDYRLDVTFAKGNTRLVVPGYFAADGKAAETGAVKGNCWRVRFTPEQQGVWSYKVSFRTGKDVAISDSALAGKPAAFDGASGKFTVGPHDKTSFGFSDRGILRYAGKRYLRFSNGDYFLKGGADSPENFLAFADFDQTPARHTYAPHARDWKKDDPTWRGGRGRNIIGALNYLAGKRMNSVYFLTMNVGGDGDDVWPWTSRDERTRFDCSKLDQWEIVFSHMDKLGIAMHVVTQETENDHLLDNGDLGPQRRLYYREIIARFGYHPAVVWNLGEENTNTDAQRKAFVDYITKHDAYKHPIVVHTFPRQKVYEEVYGPLLGYPGFTGISFQIGNMKSAHGEIMKWVKRSADAGKPFVVDLDEIGPAKEGIAPDFIDPSHDLVRRYALWGSLMAGAAGVEWYFGYKFPHNDLNCEDFRSRDKMWDQTLYAIDFFRRYLDYAQMIPADELTSSPSDYCFARPGSIYAIYLPEGGATALDLGAAKGPFVVGWYNPRTGGDLMDGSIKRANGPGKVQLGAPPSDPRKDWVVVVRQQPK